MLGKIEILAVILILILLFYFVISFGAGAFSKKETNLRTKKYQFLDKVFLRVLKKYPEKMPKIFFEMFKASSISIIKFLSNKSNIIEDINIVSRMPKLIFMKALFR